MLNLRNDVASLRELFEKKHRVVLYGAGAATKLLLQCYYNLFPIESLEYIVDGNSSLDGTYCVVDKNITIKIISLKHFCELCKNSQTFTLLLVPYYSLFMIKELDLVKELDQVEAYVYTFIADKSSPGKFLLRETGIPRIPKIIHYFWLGESKLPREYERNIESWRKFCPDYEILEWNEQNYDFSKYRYTKEALEHKQYMYATDMARKDVLYRYGGIYLDTDVELLKPLDDLLYHEAFIGIDDGGQVNSGSGLGAVKQNEMIREMWALYENEIFANADGSLNLTFNTFYETRLMIEKGFRIGNHCQKIGTMRCLPREVLMPGGVIGLRDDYTERTIAHHKINPYNREEIAAVQERLYSAEALGTC